MLVHASQPVLVMGMHAHMPYISNCVCVCVCTYTSRETEITEDSDEEMEVESSPTSSTLKVAKTPKHDLMMVEEVRTWCAAIRMCRHLFTPP